MAIAGLTEPCDWPRKPEIHFFANAQQLLRGRPLCIAAHFQYVHSGMRPETRSAASLGDTRDNSGKDRGVSFQLASLPYSPFPHLPRLHIWQAGSLPHD